MKTSFLMNILCVGLCLTPVFCQAQQQNAIDRLNTRFQAADADHNGHLSREEAQQGMPFVAKHFDQIAGEKGFITLDDLQAALREMAQKRQSN